MVVVVPEATAAGAVAVVAVAVVVDYRVRLTLRGASWRFIFLDYYCEFALVEITSAAAAGMFIFVDVGVCLWCVCIVCTVCIYRVWGVSCMSRVELIGFRAADWLTTRV